MIQLIIRTLISVAANAVGLLAAAYVLDDFEINFSSFIIAVIIFSVATIVLGPLVVSVTRQYAPYLLGGVALVTTLISLVLTSLVSDAFDIRGVSTWLIATVTIWIFSVIGNLVIPWVLIKYAILDDPDKRAA